MTGTNFEQLDFFDFFKDFVDCSVHDKLVEVFNLNKDEKLVYSDISYYPLYTREKETKSKLLSKLFVKHDLIHQQYIDLSIDEIESTGASWDEFLNFLEESPAKFVKASSVY
jgi:hypothetical protein